VQAEPLSLDEKCKKLEEIIQQRDTTNTIGYTRKQAKPESEPSKTTPKGQRVFTN
jgi:hypothetical protein